MPPKTAAIIKWQKPFTDGSIRGKGKSGAIYDVGQRPVNKQGRSVNPLVGAGAFWKWFYESRGSEGGPFDSPEEAKASCFNMEESALVGKKAKARSKAAANAKIAESGRHLFSISCTSCGNSYEQWTAHPPSSCKDCGAATKVTQLKDLEAKIDAHLAPKPSRSKSSLRAQAKTKAVVERMRKARAAGLQDFDDQLEAKVEVAKAAIGAVAPAFVWKKEWSKKAHPAAALYPMLGEKDLADLAADIAANHQRVPIVLTKADLVLDGRNRLAACKLAGVEPDFGYWPEEDDGASPTAYVISANEHRRHLNPSQRALAAIDALKLFEVEAKRRQREAGGDRRSASAPGRLPVAGKGKASVLTAEAKHIGSRTLERAKSVLSRAPVEEIEKVRSGEKTLKQVDRETKRTEQIAQVKTYVPPTGEHGIVVFDYPWKFEDGRDGSEHARSGAEYPRMTLEEICAFPLPVAEDCLLGCWIPNALLIDGTWERIRLSLEERYGAKPKQMRTWTKTGADGGEVTGLGKAFRNDTEHLILLERGTVTYVETGADHDVPILRTSFSAPRGRGSEKPALAYEQLAAICPMRPCIDVFARDPRPGWVTSGSELPAEKAPMFIDTPAGQAAVKAINDGLKGAAPIAVHCFFECGHVERGHAATQVHEAMEKHYREVHRSQTQTSPPQKPKKRARKLTPLQTKPGYTPVGKEVA